MSATRAIPPTVEPALDMRLESLSPSLPALRSLPTFGGIVAYSASKALSALDRGTDLVLCVGGPDDAARLENRLAYLCERRIPRIGIVLGDRPRRSGPALWLEPGCWERTLEDLLHTLFAFLLDGLVCVDWHEVLAVLDTDGRFVFACAEADDPEMLSDLLVLKLARERPILAAHAALYAAPADVTLSAVRTFSRAVRAVTSERGVLAYSAPFMSRGKRRFWGGVIGVAQDQ